MTQEVFLLVDDNTLLRSSLAKLIGVWRPEALIAEASDGREGVERALALKPQVVLMDVRMPRLGGIEATRRIKESLPDTRIIMLTVSEEDVDLFDAIRSGAHGYLLKNMRPEELFERLEDALRGEAVMAPQMAQRILKILVNDPGLRLDSADKSLPLSAREIEVLESVCEGASNKEIAERLFISVGTVKNHIHNILDKLHLKNRAQIAAYGRTRRLTHW
jgi:two-component system, NarL family, nitrate/nitrite response regulator NarL